jgi:hypothetical protein
MEPTCKLRVCSALIRFSSPAAPKELVLEAVRLMAAFEARRVRFRARFKRENAILCRIEPADPGVPTATAITLG